MIPALSMQTTKKDTVKSWPGACFGRGILEAAKHGAAVRPREKIFLPLLVSVGLVLFLAGCTPAGPRAVLEGKRLFERGDYAEAAEQLRAATRLMPTNALAFNYLGLALHHSGQPAEAERAYLRALTLDKDLIEVRYDLGCFYLEQSNRLEQAKSELIAYTLHRPNNPEGWWKLGQAQLRNRELSAADHSLAEAVRLDPHNAEILTTLGLVQYQRKRPLDAEQYFARALKEQPNYGPALLNSGIVAQQELNDSRLALLRYRQYASLKPPPENLPAVLTLISQLDQQLAPPPREVATNRLAVPSNPATNAPKPAVPEPSHGGSSGKAAVSTNAAHAVSARSELPVTNKTSASPAVAHQVPATNTTPPETLPVVHLAAEPIIKPAEDVQVASTKPSPEQGSTSIAPEPQGAAQGSKPPQKHSLLHRLNPINLFSHDEKAGVTPITQPRVSTNATDTASTTAGPARSDPGKFPRYTYLSPEKPAAGDRTASEQAFAQGVQFQQKRQLPEALQAYRRATQLDASFYDAQYNLGLAASETGNPTLALSAYEMALAIQPESLDARYNFGLVLRQSGYVLDASTQFEKILSQYPNEARAHLALGNLYAQQLRNFPKARHHYQAVLAVAPQSPQAGAIRYWLSDHPQ
jgi:tetratricopeptide (TPR) repeat protein